MSKPFSKDYALTQGWGVNEPSYRRFGLKGHNGTDWALPNGTQVLAPHDGKVLEVADEGNDGYGKYIKIESSIEGSLVAHLKEQKVKVGDQVKEGSLLGLSNSTGNSTGPHLHWGYYRIPRNRADGYAGYIDPFPYIKDVSPVKSVTLDSVTFERLVTKSTQYDEIQPKYQAIEKEVGDLKNELNDRQNAINTLNLKISDLNQAMEADAVEDHDMGVKILEYERKITELNNEIARIKEEKTVPIEPVIEHYEEIIEGFWPNLFRGRRTKSIIKRVSDKLWKWFR